MKKLALILLLFASPSWADIIAGPVGGQINLIGRLSVGTLAAIAPQENDMVFIYDGDTACDTTTGGGAYSYFLYYDGTDWVCVGDGGATASQIDGLTDVTGEGSANYILKDDGDGTYSFVAITDYEAALEAVLDLQDLQGAVTDAQVPNDITITESDPNALLTAGTDNVKDTHIDWGSGANQVDLADIPGGVAGASAFDLGGATSVEVPNGANPTTDAAGEITVDTDDHFIEIYSDASRVAVTKYTAQMTIWDPDTIQGTEDAIPMLAVEADWAPHGITIVDCGWKSDAAVTMTIGFEEWTSPTDGSPVTIEDVASGSDVAEQADDGTLADAAVAAGSIVMIDLDTDALNYVQVWFTYFVNPGD